MNCTRARRNSAACGTNEGNRTSRFASLLRAGGRALSTGAETSRTQTASIQIYTILTLFYVQNSMSTILVRFVSLRKRVEFRRISRLNRQKLFVGDFLEDFAPNRNTFGVCPG